MLQKPIQPGMAWNTGVVTVDAVHFYLVLATGSRAASVIVAPRSPAVHQPLRIGPGALVEANPVHIRQQPLSVPAQHPLLCLHSQKSEEHHRQDHSTYKEDKAYSPLSKGHI
jgi:hypothetical protein